MPNYKQAFGNFIKHEDLQGRALRVTVEEIGTETVKGDKGDELKLVAKFAGKEKRLILNRTNADAIAEIAGDDDTDNWAGTVVEIYPDKTKFGGKTVDCVRVRAPRAAAAAPKRTATRVVEPEPEPQVDPSGLTDDDIPF